MFATKRNLLRMLERERESFALERSRMIDQICNLAGNPWTPPPVQAENFPELSLVEPYEASPEQVPEY